MNEHFFDTHFEENKRIPIKKALIWILLSTLLVSGTATMGYLYYQHWLEARKSDKSYVISEIKQITESNQTLDTNHLASILNLSIDRPINLHTFSLGEAQKKLQESTLFSDCDIKKQGMGTVVIYYTLRKALGSVADLEEGLIDRKGVIYPKLSYLNPEKLPRVYFGLKSVQWGQKVDKKLMEICHNILSFFNDDSKFQLEQIDLSHAFDSSYGSREIILTIHTNSNTHYLRCATKEYLKAFQHYQTLFPLLHKEFQPIVIDLRIPHQAYIR